MNKTILSLALIVIAIIAIGGYVFPDSKNVVQEKLGAVSGPDLLSPYFSVNEVKHEYRRTALATATTTPCAIKSPTATSTLLHSSLQIRTASSTATTWTVAKASTAFATTSPLFGSFSLGSGAQGTMVYHASSSTATVDKGDTFSPNTWLVWGVAGTVPADTSKLNGVCQAEFLVN